MITRRHFLLTGLRGLGAWAIGAEAARRILHLAAEEHEPYLIPVEKPAVTLWANTCGNGYLFTLGCPYDQMEAPCLTWREWLDEIKGVDVSKPGEIREFLEESGWYCPEGGEIYVPPVLDELLPEGLQQQYEDWEFSMHDAPTAKAYSYLEGMGLANRSGRGEALGGLEFEMGPCPGNNSFLVSATNVETLGGLQQRLLELGRNVEISVNSI